MLATASSSTARAVPWPLHRPSDSSSGQRRSRGIRLARADLLAGGDCAAGLSSLLVAGAFLAASSAASRGSKNAPRQGRTSKLIRQASRVTSGEDAERAVRKMSEAVEMLDRIEQAVFDGRISKRKTTAAARAVKELRSIARGEMFLGRKVPRVGETKESKRQKAVLKEVLKPRKRSTKEAWRVGISKRSGEDDDKDEFKPILPPPPMRDPAPSAVHNRCKVATGLKQVLTSMESIKGSSELPGLEVSRHKKKLQQLLAEVDEGNAQVLGKDVQVQGITDIAPLARDDEAVLLEWKDGVEDEVEEAVQKGATALILWAQKAIPVDELQQFLDRHKGQSNEDTGLQAVVALPSWPQASKLVQAYYGYPAETLRAAGTEITVVVGGEPATVHTASWLLHGFHNEKLSLGRTAFVSGRRSRVAAGEVEIGRPLTLCTVQELLLEASESEVLNGACVVEIAPSLCTPGAFDGLSATTMVIAGDCTPEGAALVSELSARAAPECLTVMPANMRGKKDDATVTYAFRDEDGETEAAKVQAEVLSSYAGTNIQFFGGEAEGDARITGHFMTVGSQACLGTLAAFSAATAQELGDDWNDDQAQDIARTLAFVGPAPGIFEAFVLEKVSCLEGCLNDPPVVIYHEAKTPAEVEQTLQVVRNWIRWSNEDIARTELEHLGEEVVFGSDPVIESTLSAVLGCSSTTPPRVRAQFGMVLAKTADKAVLTTDNPGKEFPMQLIEDHLAALKLACRRLEQSGNEKACSQVLAIADRVDAIKQGIALGFISPKELQTRLKGQVENPIVAEIEAVQQAIREPAKIKAEKLSGCRFRNYVVVFGPAFRDFQQVVDEDGRIRNWYCNDRHTIREGIKVLDGLRIQQTRGEFDEIEWEGVDFTIPWKYTLVDEKKIKPERETVAWDSKQRVMSRSLHWTDNYYILKKEKGRTPL